MRKAITTGPASKRKTRTKTTPFDVAAYLRTTEDMAAYPDAWLTEAPDDAAGIAHALSVLARAKGTTQVAKGAGLGPENLNRVLGPEGNPSFATVLKVVKALGVRLHVEAATQQPTTRRPPWHCAGTGAHPRPGPASGLRDRHPGSPNARGALQAPSSRRTRLSPARQPCQHSARQPCRMWHGHCLSNAHATSACAADPCAHEPPYPHLAPGEPLVTHPAKDTTKMSSTELREYAERLMKQAEEQATKEFESTLNFLSDKLSMMGKTKKDAVIHLVKMMKSHEAEETLAELAEGAGFTSPRRAKERGDLDSEGHAPEIGVTYQLPTGETWSRKSKVGATKREFAAFAKTTTWAAMKV